MRIDFIAPSLTAIYAGVHWSKRKKLADEAHLATKIAARGHLKHQGAVHLTFQPMIRGRCYDVSNYSFSAKLIEDGLVKAGILIDDTNKYVKSITIKEPVKVKKPEVSHMIVTITDTTKL